MELKNLAIVTYRFPGGVDSWLVNSEQAEASCIAMILEQFTVTDLTLLQQRHILELVTAGKFDEARQAWANATDEVFTIFPCLYRSSMASEVKELAGDKLALIDFHG